MAQSVRQINERDSGIHQFKASAGKRVGDGAANIHGEVSGTVRQNVGIKTLRQFEVETSPRVKVERVFAGHSQAALHEKVGVLANQVKLLGPYCLVIHGKAYGALILNFYVADIGCELADSSGDTKVAGPAQWPANIRRAGDRRVPGDQALEVSAKQGIEIYIRELQRHLRGIIAAHLHCAIQIEACILEVGAASHYQLRPSRLDHGIYGTQGFVIQLEIGDV